MITEGNYCLGEKKHDYGMIILFLKLVIKSNLFIKNLKQKQLTKVLYRRVKT